MGNVRYRPIELVFQTVLIISTKSDFADLHPSAHVVGTDLSPIQPTWIPPNLQFEVSDCCDKWMYKKESFDFVHIRGLFGCVADWRAFYQEVLRYVILHIIKVKRMALML